MQGEDIQKNPEKEDSGDGEPSKNVVPDSQLPELNTTTHQPWGHPRKDYVVSITTGCCVSYLCEVTIYVVSGMWADPSRYLEMWVQEPMICDKSCLNCTPQGLFSFWRQELVDENTKIRRKITELEERISSLELKNVRSAEADPSLEITPPKTSFLAECAMARIPALRKITPTRLERFFSSAGGPSGAQTPRPSPLEVLNKGKLKGRMGVQLSHSQGVDTRAPGSRCGDLQGMTCSMEPGLDFDAATDDNDVACLGTQVPHIAKSPVVKDQGNPKRMRPSGVFHVPADRPPSLVAGGSKRQQEAAGAQEVCIRPASLAIVCSRAYASQMTECYPIVVQKGDEAWRRFLRGPSGTGTPGPKKRVGVRGVGAHTVMPVGVYFISKMVAWT